MRGVTRVAVALIGRHMFGSGYTVPDVSPAPIAAPLFVRPGSQAVNARLRHGLTSSRYKASLFQQPVQLLVSCTQAVVNSALADIHNPGNVSDA